MDLFLLPAGVQHWDARLEEEAEAGKKLQEASPALKHLQEGWGHLCHVQSLCWCCTYSLMFETPSGTNCGPQPQLGLQDALFFFERSLLGCSLSWGRLSQSYFLNFNERSCLQENGRGHFSEQCCLEKEISSTWKQAALDSDERWWWL